jgi:hypothetical protein
VVLRAGSLDQLDSRRRLEQRAPELAAAINRIFALPPGEALVALLGLAEERLPQEMLLSAASRIGPVRAWLAEARR